MLVEAQFAPGPQHPPELGPLPAPASITTPVSPASCSSRISPWPIRSFLAARQAMNRANTGC